MPEAWLLSPALLLATPRWPCCAGGSRLVPPHPVHDLLRVARLEGLGVSRPAPTRRLRWQQQVEAVDALVGAVGFPAAHALLVLAPANAAADMAAHAMHSSSGSSGGTSSGSRGLADGSSAAAPEGPQQRAAGGSMTAEEAAAVVRWHHTLRAAQLPARLAHALAARGLMPAR